MPVERLLTKSRFTLASECPAKLNFAGKADEYANTESDDEFLMALADGGYQVEALAKCHFPRGIAIDSVDPYEASIRTKDCLDMDGCVIYQAAFSHGSLHIRSDIVERDGDTLLLYEVKAKSWDPTDNSPFFDKREEKKARTVLKATYRTHLLEVAFQTFVIRKAYPQFKVVPHLILVDKTGVSKDAAINQRFVLHRLPNGRPWTAATLEGTDETLGRELLVTVPVLDAVERVLAKKDFALSPDFERGALDFEQLVQSLAVATADDLRIDVPAGPQCKNCQFVADPNAKAKGLKSGFDECWNKALSRRPDGTPVFRLWSFRTGKLFEQGKYFLEDVEEGDIKPKAADEPGLSNSQRQWQQVQMAIQGTSKPYVDCVGLAREMDGWTTPYHFIDFETSRPALPFSEGRRPYETVAFQFSHHLVHQDGRIEHRSQWISQRQGVFPNFEFVRRLMTDLTEDEGTVFRYAAHENTTLIEIHRQLKAASDREVGNRDKLCRWIESITESREWRGPRAMVDMHELVKRYYQHPLQMGSNSLKAVLPAILATSQHLQSVYSRPIYGERGHIPSANFGGSPMAWVQWDGERVRDPYSLLPPIFSDYDEKTLEAITPESEIGSGGAAMVAYGRMQFTEMSETERHRIVSALLRYCELDTLAMVFLFEHWMELLGRLKIERAA